MRSCDGVRVAQGVRGNDLGVLATDAMGGRVRSGETPSVLPPPQQPPPPEALRRLERRDELLSGVPAGTKRSGVVAAIGVFAAVGVPAGVGVRSPQKNWPAMALCSGVKF